MTTVEELQSQIDEIKNRNKKVESDKAWETSVFRKVIISVFTYIVIVLFFFFAGLANPFVNAIVPALAFLISTLSIPLFKKWWIENVYKAK